jgi:hypothetical protein
LARSETPSRSLTSKVSDLAQQVSALDLFARRRALLHERLVGGEDLLFGVLLAAGGEEQGAERPDGHGDRSALHVDSRLPNMLEGPGE